MVMEGRRLRARGRGGGEGIRRESVRGCSSVVRRVRDIEQPCCVTNVPSSEGRSGSLCRTESSLWVYGSGDALFSVLRKRFGDGDFFCESRDMSEDSES